jgi:hypothetical protein
MPHGIRPSSMSLRAKVDSGKAADTAHELEQMYAAQKATWDPKLSRRRRRIGWQRVGVLKRVNEAVGLAQVWAHPFSLAFAEVFIGFLHLFRREARAAQEYGETAIALCAEHGFTGLMDPAIALRGGDSSAGTP